jgi:hypothetical protein
MMIFMSKPTEHIKKDLVLPEYLVKLGSYMTLGPHGKIPLNYVVQIDLTKDMAILERIKNDPQFSERFTISKMTPVKVDEAEKMKTGTVAVTLKATR